jgi:type IV pilus assembly protein PilV
MLMKAGLRPMRRGQAGATLIEVLVSMLILMFGLLGLVGVMVQSQRAQVEAFQREQALLIAQDMVNRMTVNKAAVACYVLASYLGVDHTTPPASTSCASGTSAQKTRFANDMSDWLSMLQGAATAVGTSSVGGVPDARGCITKDATTGIYQVSVAWQGSVSSSAPPAGITCGNTSYTPDESRRAVALTVLL